MSNTYTLQPNNGLDTRIYGGAHTTNYATETTLWCGKYAAVNRVLVKFVGLSDGTIPTDLIVESANLTLKIINEGADTASNYLWYRQKKAWVEAEATWDIYKTGSNWTADGGFDAADCEQVAIGTLAFGAGDSGDKTWSLDIAAIQEIIAGTFTNNGFLLKTDNEVNTTGYNFGSSENVTEGNRPKLVIVGSLPDAGVVGPYMKNIKEKWNRYWRGWRFNNGIFQPGELGLNI